MGTGKIGDLGGDLGRDLGGGLQRPGDVLMDHRHMSYATGDSGEAVITAFLRTNGFSVTRTLRRSADCVDVEAEYGGYRVLIEVKAAEFPAVPDAISPEEERDILGRANREHRLALEARVQLHGQVEAPEISLRYLH